MADDAVPLTEPQWTYQAGDASIQYLHHMTTCLLERMLKSSYIHVNYDKIREVTQEIDKNPALFLSRLTEAVQKCTNLDISTPADSYTYTSSSQVSQPPIFTENYAS